MQRLRLVREQAVDAFRAAIPDPEVPDLWAGAVAIAAEGHPGLDRAPLDRRLIEPGLLSGEEIGWLDSYHARVWDEISPLVGPEAALVAATGVDPLVVWPAPHPATSALTPIAAAAQAMR